MPDRAAQRVLEAWTDRLRPASERRARAGWAAACEATDAHRAAVEETSRELDRLFHDPVGHGKVAQSLEERIEDPGLRRALEVLALRLRPHRRPRPDELVALEVGLGEAFARFRAEVDGHALSGHDVTTALRTETNEDRLERVWRAAVGIGTHVAERVREAARLRNIHARSMGEPDYRALKWAAEEVDLDRLDAFLDALARGTDAPWGAARGDLDDLVAARLGRRPSRLEAWHQGDVFLQVPPPDPAAGPDPFAPRDPADLTRRTFDGLGFAMDEVWARSDLQPREGKNPHAFCTHLDREGDVRVLANVVPGARWTRTLLHEFGHAAYDRHLDFDLPWILRRPPHASVTEGVAMLFGRLPEEPVWREGIAGLPPDPSADARRRLGLLTFVRWGLVMSRFEERLYADPDGDLDSAWWNLVERYQGVPRPDPCPEGAWAAKIHVACWPCYYPSYLLGEAVASRLAAHVAATWSAKGLVDNVEAGAWLREAVFAPGATRPWEILVEEATGAPPDADALLGDVRAPGVAD